MTTKMLAVLGFNSCFIFVQVLLAQSPNDCSVQRDFKSRASTQQVHTWVAIKNKDEHLHYLASIKFHQVKLTASE